MCQCQESCKKLACILEALEQEYGRSEGIQAHSRLRQPHVKVFTLGANETQTYDVRRAIGKPATRGHIKNSPGSGGEVGVYLGGVDGKVFGGPDGYPLEPGTVYDLSSVVYVIRITAGPDGARVTLHLQ